MRPLTSQEKGRNATATNSVLVLEALLPPSGSFTLHSQLKRGKSLRRTEMGGGFDSLRLEDDFESEFTLAEVTLISCY